MYCSSILHQYIKDININKKKRLEGGGLPRSRCPAAAADVAGVAAASVGGAPAAGVGGASAATAGAAAVAAVVVDIAAAAMPLLQLPRLRPFLPLTLSRLLLGGSSCGHSWC